MHIPSSYELYIQNEMIRYGLETNEENDFPSWLVLEHETYDWISRLSRKMGSPLNDHIVSKGRLKQIEQIPTIRFLRYRDISPGLKEAIEEIASEFDSLQKDLKKAEMWRRPNLLSREGIDRWRRATESVCNCLMVQPDPEWRENWEKEKYYPYCTRREATAIAFEYVRKYKKIDLTEIDQYDGKHKYSYNSKAKYGVLKMSYGMWSRKASLSFHNIGVIEVDMLSKRVIKDLGV